MNFVKVTHKSMDGVEMVQAAYINFDLVTDIHQYPDYTRIYFSYMYNDFEQGWVDVKETAKHLIDVMNLQKGAK